ncbi:MAG TPA: isoaspartyl peptidase/L-asparaginase family protein [Nitrospiraceae bacterium]|nr:isoaspartyl peptidase/L-asparaginase family protein [Nitrospiraceae bacterium]
MAHGGAGRRAMTAAQQACLAAALVGGHEVLRHGASSVEAVEKTIRVLESSGLFNAGVGSRLQLDGVRRMDASIMEGHRLRAGAVAAIEQIRHPITAARLMMEETEHVLLVGESATRFARYFKLKLDRQPIPRRSSFKTVRPQQASGPTQKTLDLYRAMRIRRRVGLETVGAVALDRGGTVAAGASTGGIALMLPGRVGDTPLIGCGVYADNVSGAVSMTGVGEGIIRIAVAKEIVDRLAAGASPAAAARLALKKLVVRIRGAAGALVLAPDGRFTIQHTTPRMAAGYWGGGGKPVVADRFT